MLDDREKPGRPESSADGEGTSASKKPYSPPRIFVYGELRELTLGGSPGTGDSGALFTERPP